MSYFDQYAEQFLVDYGNIGLFLLSFTEAFIQPVPTAVLILIAVALSFALLPTLLLAFVANILGSIAGYWLGRGIGTPVCEWLFKPKHMTRIEHFFDKYGIWAVLIAGITPLPFKVVVVASGAFRMPFIPFFLMALVARTIHFGLIWGGLVFVQNMTLDLAW